MTLRTGLPRKIVHLPGRPSLCSRLKTGFRGPSVPEYFPLWFHVLSSLAKPVTFAAKLSASIPLSYMAALAWFPGEVAFEPRRPCGLSGDNLWHGRNSQIISDVII